MDKKIVELDSLRALMAFAVFVSHVQFLAGAEIWAFPLGGVAVTVFVMLSGFAITKSLIGSKATYGQYIARRFWRIYPVYCIGLILGLCTSWMEPALLAQLGWVHGPSVERIVNRAISEREFFGSHLFAHIALIHGAIPDSLLYGSSLAFNSAAWSLSLEWQFYLVAPGLLWFVTWALKAPWPLRALFIASSVALLAAGRIYFSPFFTQVPSFLPQQLCFFVIGILSAIYIERVAAKRTALLLCGASLVLLGFAMGTLGNIIPLSVWALTLITAAHTAPSFLAPLRRLLSSPVLAKAGEASYSFYIIHLPILLVCASLAKHLFPHMTSHHGFEALLFGMAVIPTFALAWLLFVRLETPINTWAKSRFRGKTLVSVATA